MDRIAKKSREGHQQTKTTTRIRSTHYLRTLDQDPSKQQPSIDAIERVKAMVIHFMQ